MGWVYNRTSRFFLRAHTRLFSSHTCRWRFVSVLSVTREMSMWLYIFLFNVRRVKFTVFLCLCTFTASNINLPLYLSHANSLVVWMDMYFRSEDVPIWSKLKYLDNYLIDFIWKFDKFIVPRWLILLTSVTHWLFLPPRGWRLQLVIKSPQLWVGLS